MPLCAAAWGDLGHARGVSSNDHHPLAHLGEGAARQDDVRGFWTILALAAIAGAVWWGIRQLEPTIRQARASADAVEVCNAAFAGSNTIGDTLAPAVVASFLAARGYEVSEPARVAMDESRIVGVRDTRRCTIDFRAHGSSNAFTELASGSALIGMASRAIRPDEIERLRAAGAGDFAMQADAAEHVVALDGLAIIVHPSNPLRAMALADVRRAFTGRARSWRAFGGADQAIALYARDDNSGTFQFFFERALRSAPEWAAVQSQARRFESSTQLVDAVAADPAGIGFVGAGFVTAGVRALAISDGGPAIAPTAQSVRAEDYPLSRRLYLYVRPDTMQSNRFVAALIAYFKSPDAFAAIEGAHAVALRAQADEPGVAAPLASTCAAGAAESEVYRALTADARRMDAVIRFLPGSNAVDSLARDDIGRTAPTIAQALRDGAVVRLIGHSDSDGDDANNRRLARERADAIRLAFESMGLYGLQVDSAGEMCPIADNSAPDGRQANRRVEIWIATRRG
jgi:phosphate transport system substrate-binding protein